MKPRDVIARALEPHIYLKQRRKLTDELIAAIDAAGFAVVPKVATEEMRQAAHLAAYIVSYGGDHGSSAQAAYTAMLSAAKEGGE